MPFPLRGELPSADKHVQYTVKGYLRGCLQLVYNKVFILGTLGLTIKTIYAVGMAGFVLKIIVIKFGVSQVKAGMVIGVSIFLAMTSKFVCTCTFEILLFSHGILLSSTLASRKIDNY